MKKIVALMMLCLLLCAMSATAMAATAYDLFDNYADDIPVSEGVYTLPEYPAGFTLPDGKEFYGWRIYGLRCYSAYYKPGTKININSTTILSDGLEEVGFCASYIDKGAKTKNEIYEVEFTSVDYNNTGAKGYWFTIPDGLFDLSWPFNYGFGTEQEQHEEFLYWEVVEGKIRTYNGKDYLAAIDKKDLEIQYQVNSPKLVLKAIWRNGSNGGDDDDNGGNTEPSAPKYNVNVIASENGSVSVSKTQAEEGEHVTITVAPAEGYGLDTLTVTHTNDATQTVTVTNKSFTMPASDVDVQATFVQRNKVIFNANGGECATASATVNAANKLDELPKATREGYLFIGWFTQAEGGTAITKETVFDQAETTVYAQWYNAKHTTKPDENAFKADIDMEDSDILDLLIDEDDKKDKEDIVVYLTVKEENEADVDSDDKTAIVNKAGEDKIAAYLDIELFKKIGDKEPEKIYNTGDMVRIKLKLEDALIPENPVKDSFYIIYYHDGVAKSIPASFDVATKELTFEAYEFSTYSLVYKTQTAEDVNVSLPKTGDNSLPMAFLMLMLAASVGGIVLMAKRRTN